MTYWNLSNPGRDEEIWQGMGYDLPADTIALSAGSAEALPFVFRASGAPNRPRGQTVGSMGAMGMTRSMGPRGRGSVMTGNILSDAVTIVTHPADDVDAIKNAVSSVASAIPGVDFVGDQIKTFAGTAIGKVVLTALGSSVYPALAGVIGNQAAAIAFATPGLVQGQPADQAFWAGFSDRMQKFAEIAGPEAAKTAAGLLEPIAAFIQTQSDIAAKTWNDAYQTGAKSLQDVAASAAKKLGAAVREDATQAALDLINRTDSFARNAIHIDTPFGAVDVPAHPGKTFDYATGKQIIPHAVWNPGDRLVTLSGGMFFGAADPASPPLARMYMAGTPLSCNAVAAALDAMVMVKPIDPSLPSPAFVLASNVRAATPAEIKAQDAKQILATAVAMKKGALVVVSTPAQLHAQSNPTSAVTAALPKGTRLTLINNVAPSDAFAAVSINGKIGFVQTGFIHLPPLVSAGGRLLSGPAGKWSPSPISFSPGPLPLGTPPAMPLPPGTRLVALGDVYLDSPTVPVQAVPPVTGVPFGTPIFVSTAGLTVDPILFPKGTTLAFKGAQDASNVLYADPQVSQQKAHFPKGTKCILLADLSMSDKAANVAVAGQTGFALSGFVDVPAKYPGNTFLLVTKDTVAAPQTNPAALTDLVMGKQASQNLISVKAGMVVLATTDVPPLGTTLVGLPFATGTATGTAFMRVADLLPTLAPPNPPLPAAAMAAIALNPAATTSSAAIQYVQAVKTQAAAGNPQAQVAAAALDRGADLLVRENCVRYYSAMHDHQPLPKMTWPKVAVVTLNGVPFTGPTPTHTAGIRHLSGAPAPASRCHCHDS